MPFISPHTSQQKIPAALLNTLQHHYFLISKYVYLTALISKYLNTFPYSFLTKSFLLESNLYNFSSGYNLIFLLSLTSLFLILPYIIYITNTTSHKTSISFTIFTLPKRYQILILKAFLMEGTNSSYIKPFS